MKQTLLLLALIFCGTAMAEMHIWTFTSGKTLEAEFISLIGGKVTLKTLEGKQAKINQVQFSAEDLTYLELLNPPKLEISFRKTSKVRVFPNSNTTLPSSAYYDFTAEIKKTTNKSYVHELKVEFFIIGEENAGDRFILLDHKKESFIFNSEVGNVFVLSSDTIELLEFYMSGQLRGDAYRGYLIMVTDLRGELLAYKATKEEWLENIENLRKVPLGKTFDEECNRCFPTRPKRFY